MALPWELSEKRLPILTVVAEKGRSKLRHYKDEEKSTGLKTGHYKPAKANRQLGMDAGD